MSTPPVTDLFAYIERKSCYEALTGCLLWLGAIDKGGYARMQLKACAPDQKASRIIWKLLRGPIPEGMVVRHHCDNPACVNIDHLALGTQKDNSNDAVSRGRLTITRGENCPSSKLTAYEVRAIRADTRKLTEIAADYSIAPQTVSAIRLRQAWRHI